MKVWCQTHSSTNPFHQGRIERCSTQGQPLPNPPRAGPGVVRERHAGVVHHEELTGLVEEAVPAALARLKAVALAGGNVFEELLSTVQHCSLGQITQALYEVGGAYRRNM